MIRKWGAVCAAIALFPILAGLVSHSCTSGNKPLRNTRISDRSRVGIYRWEGVDFGWPSGAWMQRRVADLRWGDLVAYLYGDIIVYGRVDNPPHPGITPRDGLTVVVTPIADLPPGVAEFR